MVDSGANAPSVKEWEAAVLDRFQLTEQVLSPDGKAIAYIRLRPLRSTMEHYGSIPISDLVVAKSPLWTPRTITSTLSGTTRFIADLSHIHWSPDGSMLAWSRTMAGEGFQILVSQASRHSTVFASRCFLHDPDAESAPWDFDWLDSRHIAVWIRADACHSDLARLETSFDRAGVADIVADWSRAGRGRGPNVTVSEAGTSQSRSNAHDALLVIDVVSRSTRVVASGLFEQVILSPDHRYAAIVTREPPSAIEGAPVDVRQPIRFGLAVTSLGGRSRPPILVASSSFVLGTQRWSPDAKRIAFVDSALDNAVLEPCINVYNVTSRKQLARVCGDLGQRMGGEIADVTADPILRSSQLYRSTVSWSATGDLIVKLRCTTATSCSSSTDNLNDIPEAWYVMDSVGAVVRSLEVPGAPSLFFVAGSHDFLLAGDRLYQLKARVDSVSLFGDSVANRLRARLRIVLGVQNTGSSLHILGVAGRYDGLDSIIDIQTEKNRTVVLGTDRGIDAPTSIAVGPSKNTLCVTYTVHSSNDETSLVLQCDGRMRRVLEVFPDKGAYHNNNRYTTLTFKYLSQRADSLSASILLPATYVSGRKCPLIVMVYPGQRLGTDTTAWLDRGGVPPMLEPTTYADLGYAVLFPTMPYDPAEGDPLSQLSIGVLPAVDRVIQMGIVDSTRIGLLGHSFGGYAVLGLISTTTRFRAAVALAAPANAASLYGAFEPSERYRDAPLSLRSFVSYAFLENGQFALGTTPWANSFSYINNSPFFMVDRIRTPLLLAQGDQDFVPLSQGEQLYRALARLGRPVELRRYWGEGHVFNSYDDIVDLTHAVASWFDVHLCSNRCH